MRAFNLTIGVLLVTSILAFSMPAAAHDEFNPYTGEEDVDHHHPDCEEGQPAAGGEQYTELSAGAVFVCEGEHYDGDDHANEDNGANGVDTDSSDGNVGVAVNNDAGDDEPSLTAPVRLRVSAQDDSEATAVYSETFITPVGQTSVSAEDDGERVLVGWYGEDHTPLNVLATAVSELGITRGHVADDDCDFATYENNRDTRACGRDNTAITVVITPP